MNLVYPQEIRGYTHEDTSFDTRVSLGSVVLRYIQRILCGIRVLLFVTCCKRAEN